MQLARLDGRTRIRAAARPLLVTTVCLMSPAWAQSESDSLAWLVELGDVGGVREELSSGADPAAAYHGSPLRSNRK